MSKDFFIRFWGVRGSIPAPGPDTVRYGGETTCFEIRAGNRVVFIDAGSGIRNAGLELKQEGVSKFDIFFSHFHLDHLLGIPFLTLIYDERNRINCHATVSTDGSSLADVVGKVFLPPLYPLPVGHLKSLIFNLFLTDEIFDFSTDFRLETIALNHPGGCCGYKFVHKDRSICIISDHEHGDRKIDSEIELFVKNADIMVYDGMFSDEEYGNFKGWGHSTWQEGIRLAEKTGVKKVVITHHSPAKTDAMLDEYASAAAKRHSGCIFAKEGMVLEP